METNRIKKFIKDNAVDIVCFLLGFFIMAVFLKGRSMIENSMDARVTWSFITKQGDYSSPYTLYKGILAVEPYTMLYKISTALHLSSIFLVKVYHCLLFGYLAGVGFPAVAYGFLKKKQNPILRVLLVPLLFVMYSNTGVLDNLMVDLPTCAFFVGSVHCAFSLFEHHKKGIWRYVLLGVLICINFLSSGQYTIPNLFLILYIALKSVPAVIRNIKCSETRTPYIKKLSLVILAFLLGFLPLKAADVCFRNTVVSNYDIPSIEFWMNNSYITRFYTQTFQSIPDYRGEAILKDYYGDQYSEELETRIKGRLETITFEEYMRISLTHPVDSFSRWCNRFFLSFKVDQSTDSYYQSIPSLFLSYTLLFIALTVVYRNCHTFGTLFQAKFWVVIGFIMAIMAGCATCVELRNCIQLQGLAYTVGLLDEQLWISLRNGWNDVRQCFREKSLAPIAVKKVPYVFFVYVIYIIMCLIHVAAIYEMSYVDNAEILFDFGWNI